MPTKPHILYTIPNFDTAGSGKVVYDLAKQLKKNGFKVSIACSHNKGSFFKEINSLGLPVHLIDSTVPFRPYYSLIKRSKPFRVFLKKEQVDVVHSWNWSSDWTEPLACRLSGIPFVYTKKAMSWGNKHWKIRSYLSQLIITVNTEMTMFFPRKKNQQLIPFGLDTSYYNPQKFELKKESQNFKIITVAHLVPVKHIEVLLHALQRLKHLKIHLDIVGDTRNSYAEYLKLLVTDLQLETQVTFLGLQADVRPLLAQSDLYVISSKQEGMPMALVEAMAMGIPVLGSDTSGIRYVLNDFDSLLFTESDEQALADKILMIYHLSSNEREELGQALRDYCIEHFSLSAFVAAHERLYLKLAKPSF